MYKRRAEALLDKRREVGVFRMPQRQRDALTADTVATVPAISSYSGGPDSDVAQQHDYSIATVPLTRSTLAIC